MLHAQRALPGVTLTWGVVVGGGPGGEAGGGRPPS